MFFISDDAEIHFYGLPVDLRKGTEGLAAIATTIPCSKNKEVYFVFLNRRRNRIKLLCLSSDNLFYWFIRSRKGVFAPKKTETSLISFNELLQILRGQFPSHLLKAEPSVVEARPYPHACL